MSTNYEIVVENNSPYAQEFYFFQEPAIYSGGATQVFTNSIGHGGLPGTSAKNLDKDQLIFTFVQQYYAGAQKQMAPPVVGEAQYGEVSQVPIELASNSGKPKNSTTLSIDRDTVHLSDSVFDPNVQKRAFCITTPVFNPFQNKYNIGLSCINGDGMIHLSNFIEAEPNKFTDVQPIVKFYVNTGSYTPGTIVNFTRSSANAALCNATGGKLLFRVTYNEDGTWTVN